MAHGIKSIENKGSSLPASLKQSTHFKCGSHDIDIVSKYKYLGLWFSEHYDVSIMAKALSVSASRVLGVLISKYKATGGVYSALLSPSSRRNGISHT